MEEQSSFSKTQFSTSIVTWVSAVGFFVLLMPFPDSSIYGYGTILFSLLGLLMLHLALTTRANMESGIMKILKELHSG